ncbi:hypothetical protein ABK040_007623 [Willaertia magna]
MDYIKTPKKKFKDAIESKQLSFNINDLFHGKYGTVVITERQSNGIYTTKTTTISNNNNTPMKTPTTSTIANNNNYNNDNNTSNNNYKSSKYKPSSTLIEKVTTTNNVDNNLEITPTTPKQQGFQLFSPNVAIKTQQMTKKSIAITPIREYKIQKELTKLAVGKINLFPSVVDYFQSISCPEDDLNDEENNENQKKRKRSSKQEQQVGYFNIIMEKADGNLTELIKKYNTNKTKKGNCKLPIVIVQNILFQILFALHVAQSLCKFQHNDMHIGNILFKYLPCITKKEEIKRDGIAFFEIFNNKEYIWITKCDFVIKIADYGLSRIYSKEEDEIIHSGKGHNGGSDFNQCIDLEKLKEIMQSKLVIDSSLCETREEKEMLKSYSDLKRMIKAHCGVQPKDLLQHEFFNSLKVLSTTTTGMSVSGKDDDNNDELIRYYHYYGSNHPKREENIEQPAIMIQSPMRMNKTKSIYNNNNNNNNSNNSNNNSNNSNNNNKGSSSSGNTVSVVAVGGKKKKNKFIKETIKSNGDVSSDDTKVNNGGATIAKSSEAIVSATTRITTTSNVAVNESEEIIEDNNTTKIVKRKRRKLIRSVVTDEEEEQN